MMNHIMYLHALRAGVPLTPVRKKRHVCATEISLCVGALLADVHSASAWRLYFRRSRRSFFVPGGCPRASVASAAGRERRDEGARPPARPPASWVAGVPGSRTVASQIVANHGWIDGRPLRAAWLSDAESRSQLWTLHLLILAKEFVLIKIVFRFCDELRLGLFLL